LKAQRQTSAVAVRVSHGIARERAVLGQQLASGVVSIARCARRCNGSERICKYYHMLAFCHHAVLASGSRSLALGVGASAPTPDERSDR
jgi:hypothetical protein